MGDIKEFKGQIMGGSMHPFPSDDIDPELKNSEQYCLQWMKAITQSYFDGRCGTSFNDYDRINELRLYAEGRQPIGKYKDLYLGHVETNGDTVDRTTQEIIHRDGTRECYSNINFEDIYTCAPRMMNNLMGKFEKTSHDVSVDALDEKSEMLRDRKKEQVWFKKKFKQERDLINMSLGLEPKDEILPENRQELELWDKLGGSKLDYETSMEKALGHTTNISDSDEVRRKIRRDLITFGKAASIDMVNIEEQLVYQEYIDYRDLIIQYSNRTNFSKSRYGAYPFWMTITEVIEQTGMKEEQIIAFASTMGNKFGNPAWDNAYGERQNGRWIFGDWLVPVLYAAWISTNTYYETKVKSKNAGDVTYLDKFGKFYDGEGSKKTVTTSTEVVYHAKWIPYSDIIWGFGMMNDIPRDEHGGARLPFHVYLIPGKSIMEQMVIPLDDMNLAHLIYQANKSKSPPPGVAVDVDSLENIKYGGKILDTKEIIRIYYQTGSYLYKGKKAGQPNSITPQNPFTILPGGNAIATKEFAESIALSFQELANITGIDPVSLSQDSKDTPVGIANLGVQATSDTLTPIFEAEKSIMESFFRNAAARIQLICMFNDDESKGYTSVLGVDGVNAIAQAGKNNHTYYGISIHEKPSAEKKQALLKSLEIALTPGKNGTPGIKPSQYSFITRMMDMPGGFKAAEQTLRFWEAKKEQAEIEQAQRNMKINESEQTNAFIKKNQSEMELDDRKTQNKMKLAAFQATIENKSADFDMERELKKYGVQLFADTMAQNMNLSGQNQQQQTSE